MNLELSRDALLLPLQRVFGVVEKRLALPILGHVLLEIDGYRLTLTGSDQEVELAASTVLPESVEAGEVTIPGRKMLDILRSLKENDQIQLAQQENRIEISSGRFRSQLATLPVTDFPNVEPGTATVEFSLSVAELLGLLEATAFAMAVADVRYFFNGMLFEIGRGQLRTVATNGQRLAIGEAPLQGRVRGHHQVIVPRKAVSELTRLLKDLSGLVRVQLTGNHIRVSHEEVTLTAKLIDATYPDYRKAIPAAGDKLVLVDRIALKEALSRISILSNEMYRNVRFLLLPGKIQLSTNNPMQEEAEELVSAQYDGEELEIGFNVSYIIDALNVLRGDRVSIRFQETNSPVLLEDQEDTTSRYVVSPMML